MALLSRAKKQDEVPMPPDVLEEIVSRLRLADIQSLQGYEHTDPAKVAEITRSLRSTGVLINPVVVDPERQLLVDGHHRVQAFQALGLSHIPAFTVDYLEEDLTVRGWNHATDAPPEAVQQALDQLSGPDEGPWAVVVSDPRNRELSSLAFEGPLESGECLNDLLLFLQKSGHTVNPGTEADALRGGLVHSYIRPVVGKPHVLEMVERGNRFPPEINRHLIEDRPLNLCVPLETTHDRAKFRQHLDKAFQTDAPPLAIKPGSRQGNRLYEERVTLFRTRDSA